MIDGESGLNNATSMTDSFFNLGRLYLENLKADDRVKTWDSNTPSQNA